MEKKEAALRCYESQFAKGQPAAEQWNMVNYVRNMNRYFGGTIRKEFAEPFYVVETLGLENLDTVVR